MSDSYTVFSELIPGLTPEEEKWIVDVPLWDGDGIDDDEEKLKKAIIDYGLDLKDVSSVDSFPSFDQRIVEGDWWMHSDDNCDLEHVACVVHGFIRKFRPDMVFKLTWAAYESKPLIGAFGGGWFVVSKKEIVWGNTWSEVDKVAQSSAILGGMSVEEAGRMQQQLAAEYRELLDQLMGALPDIGSSAYTAGVAYVEKRLEEDALVNKAVGEFLNIELERQEVGIGQTLSDEEYDRLCAWRYRSDIPEPKKEEEKT